MEFYIWGCHAFSDCLLQYMQTGGVTVLGFIDEQYAQSHTMFRNIPVYTPKAFKEQNSKAAIVLAIPHHLIFSLPISRLKNMQQFKEKTQQIRNEEGILNQLLHPAALIDFLPLTFNKRIILFGMQGSGNVIFTHLFQDLQKIFFPFFMRRKKTTLFFEIMARQYMQILLQVTTDAIHMHNGYEVRPVAWKIGTSHLNCKLNHKECSIYSFATREQIALTTPMYHQIPSETYLQMLNKNKFQMFYIMRNPLDIILSGLNKSNHVNQQTKETDTTAFQATALWVIDQLNAWAPLLSNFTILKYEDLITSPVQTIKSMMKKMHVPASRLVAKWLWKKHAFKQLPNTFSNHFWQGGIGKWQEYFSNEQLAFLKVAGIESLLATYQYHDVLTTFQDAVRDASCTTTIEQIGRRVRCCYGDEKTNTFDFLVQQHGAKHCQLSGNFILMSHDDETRKMISQIFQNNYLTDIADAGAHEQFGNERIRQFN